MVSPTCIMISPNVLNIPKCIHDIPLPDALMVPSDAFNTPIYSGDSPSVLNTPRCTEPPLYRVVLCLYQVHKWKYSSFFSCLIVKLCISNVTQSIVLQFVENLKKHIWFFCYFSSENVTIWNGPVNIHLIIRYK